MQYAQMENYMRRRTEAQAQAEKRYKAKTYRTFTVNANYEKIELFCNTNNISKAQLLLRSAMYIIDNDIEL